MLYQNVFNKLNETGVDYVVVGGVAVVLHGYARLTLDLDLVVELAPENAAAAIAALRDLGYEPRAPVVADEFAKAESRRQWIEEKDMTVFSMVHPDDPRRVIDLFVDYPLPFERLSENAQAVLVEETEIPIASIEDLIEIKQKAARPKDLEDIDQLQKLRSNDRRD